MFEATVGRTSANGCAYLRLKDVRRIITLCDRLVDYNAVVIDYFSCVRNYENVRKAAGKVILGAYWRRIVAVLPPPGPRPGALYKQGESDFVRLE